MRTKIDNIKRHLQKIGLSLRGRGIIGSLLLFPRRYFQRYKYRKFDFLDQVQVEEMDGSAELRIHATKYEASSEKIFRKLFNNVDWPYQESTIVDMGCGKGLSLVYAARLGFRKQIGVEYSPKLAQTAQTNLKKFSDQNRVKMNFEIVNADAAQFEIPENADCFYFFNPFDAFILNKVMQNITKSLETHPRKILIVYVNALHKYVIEKYAFEKIKYIPIKELDIYYLEGAYIYRNI